MEYEEQLHSGIRQIAHKAQPLAFAEQDEAAGLLNRQRGEHRRVGEAEDRSVSRLYVEQREFCSRCTDYYAATFNPTASMSLLRSSATR